MSKRIRFRIVRAIANCWEIIPDTKETIINTGSGVYNMVTQDFGVTLKTEKLAQQWCDLLNHEGNHVVNRKGKRKFRVRGVNFYKRYRSR